MSTTVESKQRFLPGIGPTEQAVTGQGVLSKLNILSDRLLFGTLLLVLLASPFEVGYPPLGRVLFATFTDLELAIFTLVGAMLLRLTVSAEARLRLLRLPLILPMSALIMACIVSTIFGEYRSLGVQSTYRLLMGALVFASVTEALAGARRVIAAVVAFVAGALLSATIGLLEFVPWLDIEPWLRPFKPQPTTVGGMLRLSGNFEYANGAAVYFEMALPLLLGLVLLVSSGRSAGQLFGPKLTTVRRRLLQLALFASARLLTVALILTFSRASWVGVFVTLTVLGGCCFFIAQNRSTGWVWQSVRRPLLAVVGVIALAAVYTYAAQPLLRLRLTGENDSAWYRYSLQQTGSIAQIAANNVVTVPVILSNPGPMEWNAARVPTVNLSYHWKTEGNAYYAVFDGLRTSLSHNVAPGGSIEVDAYVQAPATPGEYILEWDMVQENVSWFREKNKAPAAAMKVTVGLPVKEATLPPPAHPPVSVQSVEDADTSTVPRLQLWRTAFAMFRAHPLTGVGPDGFRNLYGKYAGKSNWNTGIYTNNTYIEMFTNLGLAGGLSFLWLLGLALWRTACNVRLLRTLRQPSVRMVAVWLGPSAALVSFAVHGFTDYFLFSTPLYTAFWFILGVGVLWPRLTGIGEEYSPIGASSEGQGRATCP